MPRHEIRMKMRLKNIFQRNAVFLKPLQIWRNLAKRVYNCRLAFRSYVVGALRKAARVDLFYFHWEKFSAE